MRSAVIDNGKFGGKSGSTPFSYCPSHAIAITMPASREPIYSQNKPVLLLEILPIILAEKLQAK
jgi:hypothetical protein